MYVQGETLIKYLSIYLSIFKHNPTYNSVSKSSSSLSRDGKLLITTLLLMLAGSCSSMSMLCTAAAVLGALIVLSIFETGLNNVSISVCALLKLFSCEITF